MELKITKEKILEAANKCSTAKQTLEILFPEAFEDEDIEMAHGRGSYNYSVLCTFKTRSNGTWAAAFPDGNANGNSIQLSNVYDWELYSKEGYQYVKPKYKK